MNPEITEVTTRTQTETEPDQAARRGRARGFAVPAFALAYVLSTVLSTNTSWHYFGTNLGVNYLPERYAMFAVLEVMLLACTLGARDNLLSEKGKPGAPGYLVWAFAIFAAFPAYAVGKDAAAGTVRLVLGPVVSVIAFHLALGLELRHKKPGIGSQSTQARISRAIGQRVMSRLGIAEQDLTALEITRRRALEKASAISTQISARSSAKRTDYRGRKLTARLEKQLERAGVAQDPQRADELLARLAVKRHANALSDLTLRSPWADRSAVLVAPADQESDDAELLTDGDLLDMDVPPAWAGMNKQAAIERADAILPGRNAAVIARLLTDRGVKVEAAYVRVARTRIAAKRAELDDEGDSDRGRVIPLQASGQ